VKITLSESEALGIRERLAGGREVTLRAEIVEVEDPPPANPEEPPALSTHENRRMHVSGVVFVFRGYRWVDRNGVVELRYYSEGRRWTASLLDCVPWLGQGQTPELALAALLDSEPRIAIAASYIPGRKRLIKVDK